MKRGPARSVEFFKGFDIYCFFGWSYGPRLVDFSPKRLIPNKSKQDSISNELTKVQQGAQKFVFSENRKKRRD